MVYKSLKLHTVSVQSEQTCPCDIICRKSEVSVQNKHAFIIVCRTVESYGLSVQSDQACPYAIVCRTVKALSIESVSILNKHVLMPLCAGQ